MELLKQRKIHWKRWTKDAWYNRGGSKRDVFAVLRMNALVRAKKKQKVKEKLKNYYKKDVYNRTQRVKETVGLYGIINSIGDIGEFIF